MQGSYEYKGKYYEFNLYIDGQGRWYWRQDGRMKLHGPFTSRLEAIQDADPMPELETA